MELLVRESVADLRVQRPGRVEVRIAFIQLVVVPSLPLVPADVLVGRALDIPGGRPGDRMHRSGIPAAAQGSHHDRRTDRQGLVQRVVVQPGSIELEARFQIDGQGFPAPVHPGVGFQLRRDEIEMLLDPQAVLPVAVPCEILAPVPVVVPVHGEPIAGLEPQARDAEHRGIAVSQEGVGAVPDEERRQPVGPVQLGQVRVDPVPLRTPPVPFAGPVEAAQEELVLRNDEVSPESGQGHPLPHVHRFEAEGQLVCDDLDLPHRVLARIMAVDIADIARERSPVGRGPAGVGARLVAFLARFRMAGDHVESGQFVQVVLPGEDDLRPVGVVPFLHLREAGGDRKLLPFVPERDFGGLAEPAQRVLQGEFLVRHRPAVTGRDGSPAGKLPFVRGRLRPGVPSGQEERRHEQERKKGTHRAGYCQLQRYKKYGFLFRTAV